MPKTNKHILRWTFILMAIPCALALASCQDMPTFIAYKDIVGHQWDSRDTVVFNVSANHHLPHIPHDGKMDKDVAVRVRVTNAFKYRALSLLVTQRDTANAIIACDTVTLTFADTQGRQQRNGFPYIEAEGHTPSLSLKEGAEHTIEVTHVMKLTQVDGIYAVGIELR